ncbi:hypothetical protein BIY24_07565 [Halobacteriovorax marinus]|uniref:phosphoribosylaminoimidazolesuccinocarboxamide synthase n=1 Tax=Halobacteriovorax marinus TaxID=97084 RepID=UPI000BC2D340|nr:phosphoribosylaminoimidazolesuccinocarboxamide synthase [Halobacteriovorax marinus]ATH07810.1 hypothetical protein BIY24_07565 [Halobacteriovorax marinus]
MNLIKEGSVKDIYHFENDLLFKFSDRYSVFDWGEMPDLIPNKGESLLEFSYNTFKFLENSENWKNWKPKDIAVDGNYYLCKTLKDFREKGVKTHLLDKVLIDGKNYLKVKKVHVPNIEFKDKSWDYREFTKKPRPINTIIPLEVIFRFGVPKGSSLLGRVSNDTYLEELGLSTRPKEGDTFKSPVIEFSTKLEDRDQYIDGAKAMDISGLSLVEFENLKSITLLLSLRLRDYFQDLGIDMWDGKFEFAFADYDEEGKREIQLIDSIGPDELRLIKDGVQLSKEVLRSLYLQTPWHENVMKSKSTAKRENRIDWKEICINELKSTPSKLESEKIETISKMYKGLSLATSKKRELLDQCIPLIKEFQNENCYPR